MLLIPPSGRLRLSRLLLKTPPIDLVRLDITPDRKNKLLLAQLAAVDLREIDILLEYYGPIINSITSWSEMDGLLEATMVSIAKDKGWSYNDPRAIRMAEQIVGRSK